MTSKPSVDRALDSLPFVDLKAQYARLQPEIDARLRAVLTHGRYVMGPEIEELEAALAAFVGCRHALAVASGTDALIIALMAHGVGRGDAVFVPSFTFTATAEVVLLLGAAPVFVDVSAATYNLDQSSLRRELAQVRADGRLRPRAVIAVDLFGLPAELPALAAFAAVEDLLLIDDAAQAMGATIGDRLIGSLAPVSTTSFFPAKPLGCYGDGGAIFTDDDEVAARMRSIRNHGEGDDRYDIVRLGVNGRLDTLQAAVLLAKLTVFADELRAREALALRYDRRLAGVVQTPPRAAGTTSAWAQYTLESDARDALKASLHEQGIPSAIYYPRPMHLQPAYVSYGGGAGSLPVSERLSGRVLSLPMHPYLASADAERICDAVIETVTRLRAEAAHERASRDAPGRR